MPVPFRARGRVLTFAFLLAVVTYLDRICISAAAPFIMEDLHLTVLQMSAVFSAFTLAYSLFEIPSGALGVVWAATWQAWFRDEPREHPGVASEELAWIEQDGGRDDRLAAATPWRTLLASRNLHAICAMYFAFGYGLYFYFTWLPTFLIKVLGFSRLSGGLFASLPFLLAGIADVFGGWLTDAWTRRRGLRAGRCYLGCGAFLVCAGLL